LILAQSNNGLNRIFEKFLSINGISVNEKNVQRRDPSNANIIYDGLYKLLNAGVDDTHIIRVGHGEHLLHAMEESAGYDYSKEGRIDALLQKRITLLEEAKLFVDAMLSTPENEIRIEEKKKPKKGKAKEKENEDGLGLCLMVEN
jgi:hypothetical protein